MSQQSVPSALNKTDPTIEELGIGLIPPSRQTKKPAELFFVWCAANIG
ncbi:allantoin permease, partial [Salmonella enterica subsp. enterica serovar Chester]|nr:allantoin permease [Salmonella enterica subsp. enterica serovar Chester]